MKTLRPTLDQLVTDGVITPVQAAAVLTALAEPGGPRRISPAAEVIGYIGGVLATVAALTVGAEFWTQLRAPSQFAIFAVVAVALWGAGRSISAVEDAAAGRLTGTLWLLSTAATAAAAWVGTDGLLGMETEPAALAAGIVATLHAFTLWRTRTEALQHIALFGTKITTGGAALALLPPPPDEVYGLGVWAFGVAWALLAMAGRLRPVGAGTAIGAVTAVVGAEILSFSSQTPGLLLSLLTVGCLFGAAAVTRSAIFVGIASVTLAIVLPQALYTWFPDSVGAPMAVFIAGSALLGGALVTIRTARGGGISSPRG